MLLFAFLAAAISTASASASRPYADVHVGTVTLRVPFPAGYCAPQGDDATYFEKLAEPDHRNATLLTLMDCRRDARLNKYLIVKAPVRALNTAIDRAQTMKELSQAIAQPDFATEMKRMPKEVGAAKSAATGVSTELVAQYAPRGHDDVCVYLAGSMSTTKNGKTEKQVVASCMTVVGHRFIELHAYENSDDPQAYKGLLRKVRAWALKIEPAHL